MSEFTIMRMNDCNKIVLNAVRNSRKQIVFWLLAVLLLCLNLGLMNVCESEGSLFVTAREILYGMTDLNAETLTPLSGQIPALLTRLSNVRVSFPRTDPFTLRLPFVLSALWLIGCSVGLVRLLKGKKAAELCGWLLLLTSPLWTFNRTACAYVMQCAFSLAAIRWYWKNRENPHWWAQLVFWATVGLAVLTGGIPQLFPAPVAVLIHILLARKKGKEQQKKQGVLPCLAGYSRILRNYRRSYRKRVVLPCLAGGLLFFPFLEFLYFSRDGFPGKFAMPDFGSLFPFPPCSMAGGLLSSACVVILIGCAFFIWYRRGMVRKADVNEVWMQYACFWVLFLTVIFNVALFPLVAAFGVMLYSVNAADDGNGDKVENANEDGDGAEDGLIFRVLDWLIPAAGVLFLAMPYLFRWLAVRYRLDPNYSITALFYFILPFFGFLCLIAYFWLRIRGRKPGRAGFLTNLDSRADRVILCLFLLVFPVVSVVLPYLFSRPPFEYRKDFCLHSQKIMLELNMKCCVFTPGVPDTVKYYMGFPLVRDNICFPTVDLDSPDGRKQLEKMLSGQANGCKHGIVILMTVREYKSLPPDHPLLKLNCYEEMISFLRRFDRKDDNGSRRMIVLWNR